VILLDIEGTTTSISFVYDVLFPRIRADLDAWLQAHRDDPALQGHVDALRALAAADAADGRDVPPIPGGPIDESLLTAVAANVRAQMDADRKTTALKSLQGAMWRDGYRSGTLLGHVYEDVPPALARWIASGARVAIYSSGSVAAQKLLFAHSVAGDLTPLLSAHFDTTTGGKKDAASYRCIAEALGVSVSAIGFVSDNPDELVAARAAGCRVVLSVRPGNPPVDTDALGVPVVHDFSALWHSVP
jgi:enolase-phosphatase E1